MKKFSPEIKNFINKVHWIFAKTYASTWPHYYIVRDQVDEKLFLKMVTHIRQYGYEGKFYKNKIIYFEDDGIVYWTMVPPLGHPNWYPVEEENIINRCQKKDSYENRLKNGTLPK